MRSARRILCALACVSALAAPLAAELRGLWVVRTALLSRDSIDEVVERAHRAGFNALFVQIRGRGDAFYRSQLVPRSPLIAAADGPDFDPLAHALQRARERGMGVHAWFNVLLTAHLPSRLPPEHVLARHPTWAMVPRSVARAGLQGSGAALLSLIRKASRRDDDVEGLYLAPASAGVGDHLEAVVRELLQRYPVDGIHWDFIRYPSPHFDHSRWALEGFRRWRDSGTGWLEGPAREPAAWNEYRRRALTALAVRLGNAARAARPGVLVSAAVVPDEASAVNIKFQDWPTWIQLGIVDALCPMTYTVDPRLYERQLVRARAHAGDGRPVWAGIGAYRQTVTETLDKIAIARRAGASGVMVFSHESLTGEAVVRLGRDAFGASAPLSTAR